MNDIERRRMITQESIDRELKNIKPIEVQVDISDKTFCERYIVYQYEPDTISKVKKLFKFVSDATNGFRDTMNCMKGYIRKKYLFFICINEYSKKIVGYCIIKNPLTKPETTTLIHPKCRNLGLSYRIRDCALNHAYANNLLSGDIVYSAAHNKNIPSIVSILRSGFIIIKFSDSDNYIHFEKYMGKGANL